MEQFSNANLKEKVENSHGIVLVVFYAGWCGACGKMLEILEQIEDRYPQISMGVLDTVINKQAVRKYHIISLPTLIFFRDGVEVKRMIGVKEKDDVEKEILEDILTH